MAIGENQAVSGQGVRVQLPKGVVSYIKDRTIRMYGYTPLPSTTDKASVSAYKKMPKCYIDYKKSCEGNSVNMAMGLGAGYFTSVISGLMWMAGGPTLISGLIIGGLCLGFDYFCYSNVKSSKNDILRQAVKLADSIGKMEPKEQKETLGLIASVDKQTASMVRALLSRK